MTKKLEALDALEALGDDQDVTSIKPLQHRMLAENASKIPGFSMSTGEPNITQPAAAACDARLTLCLERILDTASTRSQLNTPETDRRIELALSTAQNPTHNDMGGLAVAGIERTHKIKHAVSVLSTYPDLLRIIPAIYDDKSIGSTRGARRLFIAEISVIDS